MTKTIFELKPTYGCNQKCDFCCFSSIKNRQMAKKKVFSNLDFIFNKRQINTFILSGGEPTIYCYFWEILNYEREKGLKTITFTNGTLITKEIAKKLFDLNENIALKYNSSNESVQDYLAQKEGTGKLIKCALNNLLEVGYTKEGGPSLALETVITKQNYSEIEDLYKSWRKQNILPYIEILTEQGLAVENDLGINPKKGKELFEKLLDFDQKEYGITWPLTPPIVGQTCKRMLYSAYIRSDGNVQPCPGVEIVNSESNIRNNKLKWILDNSPVFKDVRNIFENIKGRCKTCVFKNCYGCRGTALFQNKGYLEEDCTCWYLCDN